MSVRSPPLCWQIRFPRHVMALTQQSGHERGPGRTIASERGFDGDLAEQFAAHLRHSDLTALSSGCTSQSLSMTTATSRMEGKRWLLLLFMIVSGSGRRCWLLSQCCWFHRTAVLRSQRTRSPDHRTSRERFRGLSASLGPFPRHRASRWSRRP